MNDFTDPRLVRGMDPRRGGRPGWGGGPGGRGQARVRRGDVQAAVLALLAEQDMHGYQIIQELAERSGGLWRPGAGSIYPTLRQLQEQGLIRSRNEGSKRVFSITDYGRRTVADTGGTEPWKQFAEAEGARVKLRQATEGLLSALAQVEAAGSDPQAEQATAIVSAARKSIYLMLAEEDA
jgi:DNA-binding PadR family transcriptional regulator